MSLKRAPYIFAALLSIVLTALVLLLPAGLQSNELIHMVTTQRVEMEPAPLWLKIGALLASVLSFLLVLPSTRLPWWVRIGLCIPVSVFGFWVSLYYPLGTLLIFLGMVQIKLMDEELKSRNSSLHTDPQAGQ